jgi:3-oxoacyl-[acyl-carrier protein] reductase
MAWRSEGPLLAGRAAFVTGGTKGIGWEVARTLAAHGADVAINGRTAASVTERADALAVEFGVRTLGLSGDVSDADAVKGFYPAIFKAWKRLDVLVNNAGTMENALLGMTTTDLVHRMMDVNAKGAIYNVQGAARLMARHKSGSIINVSSIVGTEGCEGQAVYAASKAAVIGLTLAAAKELAPQGIRVNAVAPGYIETEMVSSLPEEVRSQRVTQIGLGRAGTPEDVARAVLFLASDLSGYVTGQVLGVDGGLRI